MFTSISFSYPIYLCSSLSDYLTFSMYFLTHFPGAQICMHIWIFFKKAHLYSIASFSPSSWFFFFLTKIKLVFFWVFFFFLLTLFFFFFFYFFFCYFFFFPLPLFPLAVCFFFFLTKIKLVLFWDFLLLLVA